MIQHVSANDQRTPPYWLIVGAPSNWSFSFNNGSLWGVKQFREMEALWNFMQEGDGLLYYASGKVRGVIGCGVVRTKFRQTSPLWPEETKRNEVLWPLRFEFDTEYCLPESEWQSRNYSNDNLRLITRMVLQCVPQRTVNEVRGLFGLRSSNLMSETQTELVSADSELSESLSHSELKSIVKEIGQVQGYIAEEEYPIEGNRLDVVWRRVERSVPTYAFEIQVGGDIYHALTKLDYANTLWNSRLFLVARQAERRNYEKLVAGPFRDIGTRVKFLDASSIQELFLRKLSYLSLEKQLGIIG